MAVSGRVHTITIPDAAEYEGDFIISPARSKWRVYHDGEGYSSTSGQVLKLGKVVRGEDDKPLSYDTKEEAIEYARAETAQRHAIRKASIAAFKAAKAQE